MYIYMYIIYIEVIYMYMIPNGHEPRCVTPSAPCSGPLCRTFLRVDGHHKPLEICMDVDFTGPLYRVACGSVRLRRVKP